MHGIETPENTRRLCLDAPGRPARPHEPRRQPPPPPRITEKRQAGPATGGPSERVPARIRRADGDGPRRAKGLTPPLCKPRPAHAAEPHPDAAPRQTGRRRNGRSPTRRRSRAAGMSAPGLQGPPKGPSSHPVRVHAADTARFPRTEPAPRGGPAHSFFFSAGRLRLWIIPASRNPSTRHATGCARRDR